MSQKQSSSCWVCGSVGATLVKHNNSRQLSADDFRITDAKYGVTEDIYQCRECGFLYCPEMPDLLHYYEKMEDAEYESTREQRAMQLRRLLAGASPSAAGKRLLDVGAGSGILIEEAIELGYEAIGVEPSIYLANAAKKRGLPVIVGSFPSDAITGKFDVITLIDIIEHVDNPREILSCVRQLLGQNGTCLIVTPDVSSLAARLLGWRWWHFRLAHVGYFNKRTLTLLLKQSGLQIDAIRRPGWFFPADYLFSRAMSYLPAFARISPPKFLKKVVVPLNLGDSLMLVCKAVPDSHTQ